MTFISYSSLTLIT